MSTVDGVRRALLRSILPVLVLASCDSPSGPVPVASVAVEAPAASLIARDTMRATATALDASGTPLSGRPIEWSSGNPAVATVDTAGLITGVAPGEVAIIARSQGRQGEARLTVLPVPVASVAVTTPATTLIAGATMQATASPRDATGAPLEGRTVQWSSGDTTVATVSAAGLITGVAPGEVTVTALSEGRAGTVTLAVLPVPVASVGVSPDTATIVAGGVRQLTATTRDAAGNVLAGRALAWASSSDAVARVGADGVVTGVAPGTVTITATSEGQSGTARVTVTSPPPAPLATPTGVRVERRSRLRAHLSWSASPEATGYRVERRAGGGAWTTLATGSSLVLTDESPRARGTTYDYRVIALAPGRSSAPSEVVSTVVPAIRLAMIGDSNLARGRSGSTNVATSYIDPTGQSIDPDRYPDHPKLLSGKVMGLRADVEAVNHGIPNTQTGTGSVDGGRPHALHVISGVTRFEAEVLGRGYPWTAQGIARVNAFAPIPADFGYYAIGINDIEAAVSPETIRDNIARAIDLWLAAGLPSTRLMVATMGPRLASSRRANIPVANRLIRELVEARGVSLIDIAALVSDDDGLTWKDPALQTGDGLHFTEATLDLIAAEIVKVIDRHAR